MLQRVNLNIKPESNYITSTIVQNIIDNNGNAIDEDGNYVNKSFHWVTKVFTNDKGTSYKKKVKEADKKEEPASLKPCTNASDFKQSFEKAKESLPMSKRWRVSSYYSEEDYKDMKMYMGTDGSTVAIHNGDIVSVCTTKEAKIRGSELLKIATENGGNKLDAYAGIYGFYVKNGFEPVSWCKFDDEYASDEWKEANNLKGIETEKLNKIPDKKLSVKREPIIFFKYTGNTKQPPLDEFLATVKPSTDYDTAMEQRDKSIQ